MFFTFDQNNSGGKWVFDGIRGLSCNVIIEADNYQEANDIAEGVGIYFNGCDSGDDCDCCGDRWYSQWRNADGTHVPMIYGEDVSSGLWHTSKIMQWSRNGIEAYVHFKDGEIRAIRIAEDPPNGEVKDEL